MPLRSKVAVVTGAGRGIGRATTLALARAGATMVGAARTPTDLQTLEAEVRSLGGTVLAVTADVSDEADAARLIATTLEAFGQVDVLVNNAGRTLRAPIA